MVNALLSLEPIIEHEGVRKLENIIVTPHRNTDRYGGVKAGYTKFEETPKQVKPVTRFDSNHRDKHHQLSVQLWEKPWDYFQKDLSDPGVLTEAESGGAKGFISHCKVDTVERDDGQKVQL